MSSSSLPPMLNDRLRAMLPTSLALADLEPAHAIAPCIASALVVLAYFLLRRTGITTPCLRGPPRHSFLSGQGRILHAAEEPSDVMEAWADEYGPIFRRPGPFGSGEVILMDPRALAHWGSNLETVYHQLPLYKTFIENLTGRGVLWADGELHKRQRRALAGGFTVGRVRDLVPLFLDNAHKCCAAWDAAFDARAGDAGESDGGTIVLDVAHWMSAVALDTIGIASFDHDFRSLAGEQSVVAAQFAALGAAPSTALSAALALLTFTFPVLERLPSKRHRDVAALNASCYTLAQKLYARERADREGGEAKDGADKSIMGLLLRAESATGGSRMSAEQITAQMRTLMIAGYDAPSSTLTWILIELVRKPEIQERLRSELAEFPGDPSVDELMDPTALPYLDALVHEALRLHPAIMETPRKAVKDDVLPLATPVTLPDGTRADRLPIAKGTVVVAPIAAANRMVSVWGPDAHEFKPERWLDGGVRIPAAVKAFPGHRHMLTFLDGPKNCLGKAFALAEVKAVLFVLVKRFAFEFPGGPATKIGRQLSIIDRPKVDGEPGVCVPMIVRRVE